MDDKNSSSAGTRLRPNSPATDQTLKSSAYVQEVTSFEPPTPCPLHYHDSLCYLCIDCRYKCLCGTCLQEGSHRGHCVRNIEKGSKIVDRVLNEALIRLRSKSDLLTNLKDYMKIRKSEIFHQYSEYEQTFIINFDTLASALAQKKHQSLLQLASHHQNISDRLDTLIDQINNESVLTLELINTVEQKLQKLKQYPTSLCLFFEDRNIGIQEMVGTATERFEFFKRRAPEVGWAVDLGVFDALRAMVGSLGVVTKDDSVQLACSFYEARKGGGKKPESKLDKVKSSYILGCRTPKNIQQNKLYLNNFKSPSTVLSRKSKGKLNSMPASPSKSKTPKKKSPGKPKIEQAGKKFKKNKK